MHRIGKGLLFAAALLIALGGLPAARGQEGTRGFINAREFAESQGIAYQWFPMQKMLVLTKGHRLMRLVVDQTQAVVDNQPFTLPSAPRLEDGQVMVPARSIIQVFGVTSNQAPPPPGPIATPPPPGPPPATIIDPGPPAVTPGANPDPAAGAILVTARHSVREDHTRVVLEFDGNVSFTTETPGPGKFKLRINGCQNLIPTKRTNPVGRDLKGVSYNSGPNRQGLVVNFDLPEGARPPTIETVGNPFRMILSFYAPPGALTASPTAAIASGPTTRVASAAPNLPKAATGSAVLSLVTAPTQLTAQPAPTVPEIAIDVPLATLSRSIFQGRAIIIEPAHGGSDKGASVPGLPSEKEITLAIGQELQRTLRKMGFAAFLLRSGDTDIPNDRRLAAINKAGGDLFVSLHVGASADENQEGAACYWYDPKGVNLEVDTGGKLSPQLVFTEWTQTTRFDLARFLGQKVRDRLTSHLGTKDRGALGLPLQPLQFLVYPGIVVEVGMLSHPQEGPRLASKGYQEAAAKAIANGIVDFFNGIRLNP
ncbi:MAG: N-acetylmuramoyl-L-alanine amidase [Candidatus Ozemobacter sibiricus]|uniref:N-acetylmuramoyl-L-alanine amidase n=1 Tax=Candidatus Ozemobacter sibiricus TaxID=2268124 RepID=A0A367ZIL0_9BACT|nr:MAG: N-acetylmuramoyl-L-alanine amidase [Candidatus Ozemobacter sibiricus]